MNRLQVVLLAAAAIALAPTMSAQTAPGISDKERAAGWHGMSPVQGLRDGCCGYQHAAVHALGSGAGQVIPPYGWSRTLREPIIA